MRLTSCFVLTVGKDMSVHVTGANEAYCIDKNHPKFQNNPSQLTMNWEGVISELHTLNIKFNL